MKEVSIYMEIVLVRHGKPTAAITGENTAKLSAAGYAFWVRSYHHTYVDKSSRPKANSSQLFPEHYVVASDLKRAVQSAQLYMNKMPEQQWPILREMHIPRYKLPFQLKAYSWLLLARMLWMLGLSKGMSNRVESFKAAKLRAKQAALQLHNLAEKQQNVIVFGHGFSNRYIRKELVKLGWKLSRKSNSFWGETCLEI